MSRSSSAEYGTPDASHSFGYIEIGVKPGIVFDLVHDERAVVAEEAVDPRHRLAPARLEHPHGQRPHLVGLARR